MCLIDETQLLHRHLLFSPFGQWVSSTVSLSSRHSETTERVTRFAGLAGGPGIKERTSWTLVPTIRFINGYVSRGLVSLTWNRCHDLVSRVPHESRHRELVDRSFVNLLTVTICPHETQT